MAVASINKELHTVYDGLPCPNCKCADESYVKTTIFGSGAFIRICDICAWSVGVDDSVNLCDLGTERWGFQVTSDRVDNACLKNHSHVPVFIGLDAELMQSICIKCLKTGIMFRNDDGKSRDANEEDAPICDINETLRIIFETNLQQNSVDEPNSPISDAIQNDIESGVDQRSDEMIAKLLNEDYTEQIQSLFVSCQCGSEECCECTSDWSARNPQSSDIPFSNDKVNPALKEEENTPIKAHVRVTDLNQLQPGDHIAWERAYVLWHHAIVECVDVSKQEIIVVENSGGLKGNPDGKMASVRKGPVKVYCEKDFLYVYKYKDDECYPPEEVIERANECLGETYNLFKYNCEHFARWCKTGVKRCLQMKGFRDRLKMASSGLVKFVEEWVMVAVRIFGNSETMGQILATGEKGAREAIKAKLGIVAGSTSLFHNLGIGTVVGSIALSVVIEVIFFVCKVFKAKKKAEKKEISWEKFRGNIVELIFEGLFGLGGGIAVGIGFSMIPYAGVFLSPLGYVVGNWIGRFLGAIVGKWVSRRLPSI